MSLLDSTIPHNSPPVLSFTDLFEQYYPRIFRYLRSRQLSEDDAAELTQQVFVQAWVHQTDYHPERGSAIAWLFGITRHFMADFHRHRPQIEDWGVYTAQQGSEPSPEDLLIRRESLLRVQSLIAALAADERELLALRFAGQLTSAEIAAFVGKSEAATKRQLSRLLHRLKEQYRQDDLDDLFPDLLAPSLSELVTALHQLYAMPITHSPMVRRFPWEQHGSPTRKDLPMDKVNLVQKFTRFTDYWSPKVVGTLNDYALKIVKVQGEFVWHRHDQTDEFFLVMEGRLGMQVREPDGEERTIWLETGDMIIIPQGVEHCPKAEVETHLLLIEPKDTLNTGNTSSERTVTEVQSI